MKTITLKWIEAGKQLAVDPSRFVPMSELHNRKSESKRCRQPAQ